MVAANASLGDLRTWTHHVKEQELWLTIHLHLQLRSRIGLSKAISTPPICPHGVNTSKVSFTSDSRIMQFSVSKIPQVSLCTVYFHGLVQTHLMSCCQDLKSWIRDSISNADHPHRGLCSKGAKRTKSIIFTIQKSRRQVLTQRHNKNCKWQ